MGYYTDYKIFIEEDIEEVKKILEAISGYTFYVMEDGIETQDDVKWYDCDKDMLKLSKLFPEITFIVNGIGEENYWKDKNTLILDIWSKQYKDGDVSNRGIKDKIENRR